MNGGQLIKNRRIELGITQQQLADACGVSKSAVCRWQTGEIGNMRRDRIAALAKKLRISPMDIVDADVTTKQSVTDAQMLFLDKYRQLRQYDRNTINRMVNGFLQEYELNKEQHKRTEGSQNEEAEIRPVPHSSHSRR